MTEPSPIQTQILRLLKTNVVMTILQLSTALNHRARSSLFRDLKPLATTSSYTHAGKYHALNTAPQFDSDGLWFYNDIGFSTYKTLNSTIVHLVHASKTGYSHKELHDLLKVKTHNTLKTLVTANKISHRKMSNNRMVYLHIDENIAEKQYALRVSLCLNSDSKVWLPPSTTTIDILAEVIRSHHVEPHAPSIFHQLKQRCIDINLETVEYVFDFYQIKKKQT